MPSPPFHLPPAAVAGWPLRRHLDLPSLLLANLTIDIEPGIAMLFDLGDVPHGFAHTVAGGTLVGAITGLVLWGVKGLLESAFGDVYPLKARVAMLSGAVGCWIHVLLDAVMYDYLQPFFPLETNPLYWPGSEDALHLIGVLLLVPALVLLVRARYWKTIPEKLTLGLLALSGVAMGIYAATGAV